MADDTSQMEIHPEDPDDEWATPANTGRAFRVRYLTGGLLALALLGGGFWGGVVAEKHHGSGSSSTLSALASRFAAARAAATGGSSTFAGAGLGGAGGALTTGTVIDVRGDVLDISDSSGNIVKITVGPSARVTRNATTPLSGVKIGDTVVVAGSKGSGGTVQATAVRASAPGAATGGGFAGGAGGLRGG